MNFIQDIEKLADLKDRGILTEAEFEQHKAQLLATQPTREGAAPEGTNPALFNVADKLLIEQRVANEKPSATTAYILWFFAALLGGHRFYLGRTTSAAWMLILSCTVVGLLITIPWAFIDLFRIPVLVGERTDAIRDRLTLRAL